VIQYLVLAFLLVHVVSYGLVASRVNSRINDKHSPDRIGLFFVGPRSLSNLWRQLFGMTFIRSNDAVLIGAGVIHILTTLTVVVLLIGTLLQDLFT
jgi:hypothetical protein